MVWCRMSWKQETIKNRKAFKKNTAKNGLFLCCMFQARTVSVSSSNLSLCKTIPLVISIVTHVNDQQ